MKQLTGHTSPETAFVVNDYPYGFTLRCKIRYWVETTKHGQRFCSQTTNPRKSSSVDIWNKPKKDTYNRFVTLLLDNDETSEKYGYVYHAGCSHYTEPEKVKAYLDKYIIEGYESKRIQDLKTDLTNHLTNVTT